MTEPTIWLSGKEASEMLRVDEKTLEFLREMGYLKPGAHWKSSTDPKQLPWNPKVFYLDAFSVLCPDLYCKNYDDLSQIYKDFSHLTSYGAMKLSNTIETFIRSK